MYSPEQYNSPTHDTTCSKTLSAQKEQVPTKLDSNILDTHNDTSTEKNTLEANQRLDQASNSLINKGDSTYYFNEVMKGVIYVGSTLIGVWIFTNPKKENVHLKHPRR